ncbi:MAG: IS5 family transposase [Methanobrevibacter sp. CfCl-M3]
MDNVINLSAEEMYEDVKKHGDKLNEINQIIDWEIFRSILSTPYKNKTNKGGRPEVDVIVMLKALIIQKIYGLSDPELERSICDRLSFRRFLGWDETIPDKATIWSFRERMTEAGVMDELWSLFNELIDNYGLKAGCELSQDASYITADPGHQKKNSPRDDVAQLF